MNQRDIASVIIGGNRVNLRPSLPQTDISGKPFKTVSAEGISNGLSDKFNGDADYGVDTLNTQTNGISELIAAYQASVLYAKFKSSGSYFNVYNAITPIGTQTYGSYIFEGAGWNALFVIQSAANGKDLFTLQTINNGSTGMIRFSDMSFNDYTSAGLNSHFNVSAIQVYLERLSISGRALSKNGLILSGGMIYVKDSLMQGINGSAININDAGAGIFFINNCSFGNGGAQPANAVYILFANGGGGTYNITDCNFTGSGAGVTAISVTGQTTNMIVQGCSFDSPIGLNLNAIINTSVIKNSPFTSGSKVQFGSSFYPFKFRIKDCPAFNPVGLLTTPFTTTVPSGGSAWVGIGAPSGTAAPVASTAYRAEVTDLMITSTGGTAVSITITDAAGNTIASGLTTLTNYYLPAGFSIDFGAFTAAPTVTVFGM